MAISPKNKVVSQRIEEQQFIRVKGGAVYHYTDQLAKRKDAVVVGAQEFADYLRESGVDEKKSVYARKFPKRGTKPKGAPKKNATATTPAPNEPPVTEDAAPKPKPAVDQALKDILGD